MGYSKMFNEKDERYIKELCEEYIEVCERYGKAVAKGNMKDERLLYGDMCVKLGKLYGVIRYIGYLNEKLYVFNIVRGTVRITDVETKEEVTY